MQLKVTKLSDFLNEALPLSLAKKVMSIPRDENVEQILNKVFSKFGRKDRVYVDIDGKSLEVIKNKLLDSLKSYWYINNYFDTIGVTIVDFINNVAKEPKQKNFTKITKILSKNKKQDLLTMYENDYTRKELQKSGTDSYKIVISKSKYDIAGMSTDRYWKSCMRLDTSKQYVEEMGTKGPESGVNAHYVPRDIKAGTIIAYLIEANDTNINKPLGRVLIKPFISESSKSEDMVWVPENVCYGNFLSTTEVKKVFLKIVKEWVKENVNSISTEKEGTFHKNPRLYNDDNMGIVDYKGGEVTKATMKGVEFTDVYGTPNINLCIAGIDCDSHYDIYDEDYEGDIDGGKIELNGNDITILNPQLFVANVEAALNFRGGIIRDYIEYLADEDKESPLGGKFREDYMYGLILAEMYKYLYVYNSKKERIEDVFNFVKELSYTDLLDNPKMIETLPVKFHEVIENISYLDDDSLRTYVNDNPLEIEIVLMDVILNYEYYKTWQSIRFDWRYIRKLSIYEKIKKDVLSISRYSNFYKFFKDVYVNIDFSNRNIDGWWDYETDKEMIALCDQFPTSTEHRFGITSIKDGVIQLEFQF